MAATWSGRHGSCRDQRARATLVRRTRRMAFGTELGCVYHARICLSQFFALQVYTYNLQGYNYSNLS